MVRKTVLLAQDRESIGNWLIQALEALIPVTFSETQSADAVASVSRINHGGAQPNNPDPGGAKRRLTLDLSKPFPSEQSTSLDVQFSDVDGLDERLRGRRFPHCSLPKSGVLDERPGDTVLARADNAPIWIQRDENGTVFDLISVAPPESDSDAFVPLRDGKYVQIIPWVHALRSLCEDIDDTPAPLRAAFMFDDPNLHWPTYGYINYPELIREASRHNYHVTFATVPLDGWWVHRKTADLFRSGSRWISLLTHGNDHTKAELTETLSEDARKAYLSQCLRRLEKLEKKADLPIDRVMAHPHGAYSEAMLGSLGDFGFEGSCISPGSLQKWALEDKTWSPNFSLRPAEFLAGRFPVIPRFRLSASCEPDVIVHAFLNRPIIPVGHHGDVAGGLELLADVAKIINSLPNVQWLRTDEIMRSNFTTRQDGAQLTVRPYTRRLRVRIPAGVRELVINDPANQVDPWSHRIQGGAWETETQTTAIPVTPETEVELLSSAIGKLDFRDIAPSRTRFWPICRRLLVEARDRVVPIIRKSKRG